MGDWYRNEEWSPEIEKQFFDKLRRSRSQRTQYLKLQAFYLLDNHPDVVLRLAEYARANCPDDFWEQEFCLYESKALYRQGKYKEAIAKAYESINWQIKKPGTKSTIAYWLPEIVLRSESADDYEKCLGLILKLHSETPFPAMEFYFHGYAAILLSRLGENAKANNKAKIAISWAEKDKNLLQNERKRKYGIFKEKYSWPISEVAEIASK